MEISETISRMKDEMLTKALYNLSLVLFHSLRLRSIKVKTLDGRAEGKCLVFEMGLRNESSGGEMRMRLPN